MPNLEYTCECGCSHKPQWGHSDFAVGGGNLIFWSCPQCGTEQCIHEVYWVEYQ